MTLGEGDEFVIVLVRVNCSHAGHASVHVMLVGKKHYEHSMNINLCMFMKIKDGQAGGCAALENR